MGVWANCSSASASKPMIADMGPSCFSDRANRWWMCERVRWDAFMLQEASGFEGWKWQNGGASDFFFCVFLEIHSSPREEKISSPQKCTLPYHMKQCSILDGGKKSQVAHSPPPIQSHPPPPPIHSHPSPP